MMQSIKELLGVGEAPLPAVKSCSFSTAWGTPSLTYCLVLVHPKHECVQPPPLCSLSCLYKVFRCGQSPDWTNSDSSALALQRLFPLSL